MNISMRIYKIGVLLSDPLYANTENLFRNTPVPITWYAITTSQKVRIPRGWIKIFIQSFPTQMHEFIHSNGIEAIMSCEGRLHHVTYQLNVPLFLLFLTHRDVDDWRDRHSRIYHEKIVNPCMLSLLCADGIFIQDKSLAPRFPDVDFFERTDDFFHRIVTIIHDIRSRAVVIGNVDKNTIDFLRGEGYTKLYRLSTTDSTSNDIKPDTFLRQYTSPNAIFEVHRMEYESFMFNSRARTLLICGFPSLSVNISNIYNVHHITGSGCFR